MTHTTASPIRIAIVRWLILPATVLLFLCSLLVLLSAPTETLWTVAIIMGEWGHYAAVVSLLFAVVAIGAGRRGRATALLAALTAVICISPTVRGFAISRSLPGRCSAAFGGNSVDAKPLDLLVLFAGRAQNGVTVTEHRYAKLKGKSLRFDLYRSSSATEPQPLVVMIHGGSWNGGGKSQLPAINRYLATRGYTVAAINYRLTPKWKSPAPVDDVFGAIEFMRTNAAQLGIDATRIVLIGRSAGGQIALSAAYSGRDAAIRGVVSFYAPTDLVLGYAKPSRRSILDSKAVLEAYLGGPPAQTLDAYVVASPVQHINETTPPTLLIHGELDPIVWSAHSELLSARLKGARRPELYLKLPWATHGCDANLSGPSGQLSVYAIERFLAAVFSDDATP